MQALKTGGISAPPKKKKKLIEESSDDSNTDEEVADTSDTNTDTDEE